MVVEEAVERSDILTEKRRRREGDNQEENI
jgi:hypothetical protein